MTPEQSSRDEQPELSSNSIDLGSGLVFSFSARPEQTEIPANLKPVHEAMLRFAMSTAIAGGLPQSMAGTICQYQRFGPLINQLLGLTRIPADPALPERSSHYTAVPLAASVGADADVTLLMGIKHSRTKSWVVFDSALRLDLGASAAEGGTFLDRCSRLSDLEGFAGVSIHIHPNSGIAGVWISLALLPKNLERECEKLTKGEKSIIGEILASEIERNEGIRPKLSAVRSGVDTSEVLKEYLLTTVEGATYAYSMGYQNSGLSLFRRYLVGFKGAAPAELKNSPDQRLVASYEQAQRDLGFAVTNLENGVTPEDPIGAALAQNAETIIKATYRSNWREEWRVSPVSLCKHSADESFQIMYTIQDHRLNCFIPGENPGVVAEDPIFSGIILGYYYNAEIAEEAAAYLPGAMKVMGQIRIDSMIVSPEWVSKQLGLLHRDPKESVLYGSLERMILRDLHHRVIVTEDLGDITVQFAAADYGQREVVGAALLCSHSAGKHLFWFRYNQTTGELGQDFGLHIETFYPNNSLGR